MLVSGNAVFWFKGYGITKNDQKTSLALNLHETHHFYCFQVNRDVYLLLCLCIQRMSILKYH